MTQTPVARAAIVGARLADARAWQRLSLEEAAKRLSLSPSELEAIEAGTLAPGNLTLELMNIAYKAPVRSYLAIDYQPPPIPDEVRAFADEAGFPDEEREDFFRWYRHASEAPQAQAERPLLFAPWEVPALLEGRKREKRMPMRRPRAPHTGYMRVSGASGLATLAGADHPYIEVRCPYVPGDDPYLREPFSTVARGEGLLVRYEVDGAERVLEQLPGELSTEGRWRVPELTPWPAEVMPAFLARVAIKITDVDVQEARELRWSQIRAEGVRCPEHDFPGGFCVSECRSLRRAWERAWNAAHGACVWEPDIWTWVLSIEPAEVRDPRRRKS